MEVFNLLFHDGLVETIVRETNRYAAQVIASKGGNKEWKTTKEEIRAYFGFMVLMGINRLPEIRDYWSTSITLRLRRKLPGIVLRRSQDIFTL